MALRGDFKDFEFNGKKVGIGKIEAPDLDEVQSRVTDIKKKMQEIKVQKRYHSLILMLTDIIQEGSKLFIISDEENKVAEMFNTKITNNRGRIEIKEKGYTKVKGVFAAGDVEMGPSSVVEAIGRGHEAAKGINEYLRGRDTLENMVERVDLVDRLRYLIREYLVIGEAFPHTFWSDDEGIWTYIGFHNSDNIEVKDAPIVNMEPIISFIPDDSLRLLLTDGTPEAMEFQKKLPAEFVAKVMARQKIRLSNLNCSFG